MNKSLLRAGQKLRCINGTFPATAAEWCDTLPRLGGTYEVSGTAIAQEKTTGATITAIVLRGFSGVAFREERFELLDAVAPAASALPKRPRTQRRDDQLPQYPRLVVRIMAAVFQTERIQVRIGEPRAQIGHRKSFVQHPVPYQPSGELAPECERLLVDAVKESVRTSGFRMCLLWDEGRCSYVERDGAVEESDSAPSGGVILFNGPVL